MTGLKDFLAAYPADIGSSVALGGGRTLWLFGDTVNKDAPWDRNSAAVQKGSRVTRIPGTFLAPSAPGHWYWPGEAVREGGMLRVMAMDFTSVEPHGFWDFHYTRTDVLSFTLPGLKPAGRTALPVTGSHAMWSQLHTARDGRTYVYGSYPVPGALGKAVDVFSVPTGHLTGAAHRRVPGHRMSPDMELGTFVSVVRTAHGYRLYSKRLDLWSDEIISYDSATPYGPWTDRRTVTVTPQTSSVWTYGVEAHPEQRAGAGNLMLTYSVNCDHVCDDYRVVPVTVEVP